MKFSLNYIALILIVLINIDCVGKKGTTDKIISDQEEIQKEIQKQLNAEFEIYVEKARPEDREYYKAYNKALTLWKIPFQEINVSTSFGNAHVIVSGPENGDPVVLLHGMNASSTMWYPNIRALSQIHRVYAIDNLTESGKSQMDKEIKNLEEVINWYFEIFDQLHLDSFSLIGASKGGWMAVNIALHQKSRIKHLILLSPLQTFMRIPPGAEISFAISYALHPKLKYLRNALKTMSVNVDAIEQAYLDQYYIATKNAINTKLLLQITLFNDNEINTLNMPVLVMIGDQDIINNEKSIEKAKELLPQIQTYIIKNAGHFLSMDQSDLVNKKILGFLNSSYNSSIEFGIHDTSGIAY